jgi:hypothetical protein
LHISAGITLPYVRKIKCEEQELFIWPLHQVVVKCHNIHEAIDYENHSIEVTLFQLQQWHGLCTNASTFGSADQAR